MESVVRKIALPIAVFYLLVSVFNVELNTFWFGMVGINVAMALVTVAYGRFMVKKLVAGEL